MTAGRESPQFARVGDLQINQDLPHERLEWKIERVAWCIVALVLAAALAGLLGPGPLSRVTAGHAGGPLRLEYNRLTRYQSSEYVRVSVGPEGVEPTGVAVTNDVAPQSTTSDSPAGRIRLFIAASFIERIHLQHIDPEPESVEVQANGSVFTFRAATEQPATIVFHYQPSAFGRIQASIHSVSSDARLDFTQFCFP